MGYWAKPGLDRYETRLFTPTLDESVGDNHPVRHLDEVLRGMDWSDWTAQYNGRVGQPPIPPWVMAGVILYGLMRRIRSSRQLEYACMNYIDFIWLAEGRTIDHDTICAFRTKFKKPLKELFKQVGRVAMTMGLIKLVEVAFDGTRVKANASRLHTWTAAKVEEAARLIKEAGARTVIMLEVSGAFHSSLMKPAADKALFYTIAVIVCVIVLWVVIFGVIGAIFGMGMMY